MDWELGQGCVGIACADVWLRAKRTQKAKESPVTDLVDHDIPEVNRFPGARTRSDPNVSFSISACQLLLATSLLSNLVGMRSPFICSMSPNTVFTAMCPLSKMSIPQVTMDFSKSTV